MKKIHIHIGVAYGISATAVLWYIAKARVETKKRKQIEAWKRQKLAEIAAERKARGL